MFNSVGFNIFIELGKPSPQLILEHFISSKGNPYPITVSPHSALPQCLATTNLLSVSLYLFWAFHINESYSMGLLGLNSLLSIVFSRFIHVVACAILCMAQ